MKKNNVAKRSLFMSALALLLCCSMLIGTTFAWFTDEVVSDRNTITAGNLDVELKYSRLVNGQWTEPAYVDGDTKVFQEGALYEPGYTEVVKFQVINAGSLALKYTFDAMVYSELEGTNVNGEKFKLSDYLYTGLIAEEDYTTREAAVAYATNQLSAGINLEDNGVLLAPGDQDAFVLVLTMPTTVENDANHLTGEGNQPKIELGVRLYATQYTKENDSFGSDYDKAAPIVDAPVNKPADNAASMVLKSKESDVVVTLPANVVAALGEDVTGASVAASVPEVDTANKTVKFSTVELKDQNGNVIDLTQKNLPGKVTVALPANGAFEEGESVEIYHDGAFVTMATVADDMITYEVSHFCEVEVKASEVKVTIPEGSDTLTINSVMEFVAFANSVNSGNSYAGKTVTLGADLDLAGVTWMPIGTSSAPFKGTFDGNGKTVKNLEVLMGGKSNVGLFGYTTDGAVKNLTVENATVTGRLNVGVVAGTPYTTKYTNITVKGDVKVNGLAYVGAVGGKNAYANWDNITVNVSKDSYVNAYSIENDNAYRTYVGGVIGFMGEGAHTVSNVASNINVIGSTCDVGGIVGIAHYGNKFENITCTGNVTINNAEEAAEAEEMGGIAGVWHNETGYQVTFTNCAFTGKLTANVAADLSNNTITGAAYSKTGNGTLVIDGEACVAVSTGDQLKAALADNKDVLFVNDITMAATESNAYGVTGINVKNGQTIDGNGYTLRVTGAGSTWGSAISTTGGLIKNLTVAQAFRGIFVNHNSTYSETVVLENVTINGPTYTINCDQGMKQNLIARNCTINGWTSYADTIGTVKFENCSFGVNGNKFIRPYTATEFVDCSFVEGLAIDAIAAITLENCTYNGAAVTAENVATLVTGNTANATVK